MQLSCIEIKRIIHEPHKKPMRGSDFSYRSTMNDPRNIKAILPTRQERLPDLNAVV
jgi:hypothetical protein